MIYKKNHHLFSVKNSQYVFHCSKCDNIVKGEIKTKVGFVWWYYLDYEKGGFWPLKDCNEMIIKKLLE